MEYGKSNMKIKHWEYNPEFLHKLDSGSAVMKVGPMRDSDTDKPTGFWFSWTYLVESGDNVGIHCLGQDSYSFPDLLAVDIEGMVYMCNKSFANFKIVFKERMDIIDVTYPEPRFVCDVDSLGKVLRQVQSEL